MKTTLETIARNTGFSKSTISRVLNNKAYASRISKETVDIIKDALNEHKAENIVIENVEDRTPFDDYYLLATANNERQLGALVEILEDELEKEGLTIERREGEAASGWIALESDRVLVHLFLAAKREEVGLDDLLAREALRRA